MSQLQSDEPSLSRSADAIVTLENATHQFDLFGSAPIRNILGQFLRGQKLTSDRFVLFWRAVCLAFFYSSTVSPL